MNKFQPEKPALRAAFQHLRGLVRTTPILPSSFREGLFYKAENLQWTGSFKVRTAFCQIDRLTESERTKGVVASSSGNFAQALAFAARRRAISAKLVMMQSSNPFKVERTRALGAEVVFCADRFEARAEAVSLIAEEEGRSVVHPYDHPNAVAGNASLGLEILRQLPDVENVVLPISGGGLIAGVASAIKLGKSEARVWGVQPEKANAAWLSYRAGEIRSIARAESVADGLAATRPGEVTFPLIRQFVDDVVTVREDSILQAVRYLLLEEKLVVEPAGAVGLAAVLEELVPVRNTVLVLSGGNIDPELLRRIL
jgi:threonine dehydratase